MIIKCVVCGQIGNPGDFLPFQRSRPTCNSSTFLLESERRPPHGYGPIISGKPEIITVVDVGYNQIRFLVTTRDYCIPTAPENGLNSTTFAVKFTKWNSQTFSRIYPEPKHESPWIYIQYNLTPKTRYLISVHGCDQGLAASKEISTLCKPLEVWYQDIQIYSARITYKLEQVGCDQIDYSFHLLSNTPGYNIGPFEKNYSILISNLKPATQYTLIATYNKEVNHSVEAQFVTKPEMRPTLKREITVHVLYNTTDYKLNWIIEETNTISAVIISWEYRNKACPYDNLTSSQVLSHLNEININANPYTDYKWFKITIQFEHKHDHVESKETNIHTTFEETFNDAEKQIIENFTSYERSIRVLFKDLKCENQTGPIFLKYEANGIEHWCKSTKLNNNNGVQFPFQATQMMTIDDLTPYCTYNVTFTISRRKYQWENAESLKPFTIITKPTVIANPIEKLAVTSKGPDHIHLRWKQPSKPTGVIKEFNIGMGTKGESTKNYLASTTETVQMCNLWPEYWCHAINTTYINAFTWYNISIIGINQNELHETELQQFLKKARNTLSDVRVRVYTQESEPGNPRNVTAEWTNYSSLKVFWKHPVETNGILTSFKIWIKIRHSDDNLEAERNFSYPIHDYVNDYKIEYDQVVELLPSPEKKYGSVKVSVVAVNNAGASQNPTYFTMPEPPLPREYNAYRQIIMAGLVLQIPKPYHDVFFEKMLIFKADNDDSGKFQKELDSIKQLLENNSTDTYINKTCIIAQLIHVHSREDEILGEIIKINGSTGLFKNNGHYKIALFIVNELNGKRNIRIVKKEVSTKNVPDDKTASSNHTALVLVMVLLILLPVIGFLIYRYRHKLHIEKNSFGGIFRRYSVPDDITPLTFIDNDNAEPSTSTDNYEDLNKIPILPDKPIHSKRIKIDTFGKYVKKSLDNEEFQQQHQLFPKSDELILQDTRFTYTYGGLPENKSKNRYNKIIPYDYTRVKLSKIPGDEYSDYINANFINGYKLPKAYIATQGPKRNTLNDFWRMIWEQNVNSIVMLSSFNKENKKECEVYWPEDNGQKSYNGIVIEFDEIKRHTTYDIRIFKVHFESKTRQVTQIQFKAWPSVGQPLYPQTLVPLLQKMLTLPYFQRSPIVVHCSAGVGRTGTVILCDICLRMAAAEGAVDVLGTLERLRNQRPNMVDNVEQYKLAHLVILACLTDWNTSVPCDGNFQTAMEGLLEDGIVPLNLSYLKESEWQDDAMKVATVSRPVPIIPEKNRYPHIVPEQQYEISLEELPSQGEKSAYINAIRVNSFRFSDRFIVTQQPLRTTLSDFWRLVLEQQCIVIINLNAIDVNDNTSVQFWPEDESEMVLQDGLKIRHFKTHQAKEYSIVTIKISYRPNEFEHTKLTVEILNFGGWQIRQDIPENMDDFVSFVEDSAVISRKSYPVMVTCHDGATASGLYVATANLIEQMKLEKQCDICKTARTIRNCRKQFVNKQDQLGFLYNAAVFYLNNFGVYHDLEQF